MSLPDDPDSGSGSAQFDTTVVGPTAPQWTDAVPARIIFDETHTSRVGSPLGGRVSGVMVELGQRVKAGAALASVTSGDLADLYSARDKAKTDLDAAQVSFDRVKTLVARGSLPKKELDSAEQDLREAQVNYSTANQKIASLKVGAGGATEFTIVAPREGVIVEKNVTVGQQVSPDTGALIAITDLSDVWVVADLLEDQVHGIAVGTKVEVTLDSAKKVEGVVGQVAQVVDPDRHTVPVRVRLPNPDGDLRPNSLAQIRFFLDNTAISIPAEAVLSDGATAYVYVIKNVTPRRQNIVVGPHNAKMIEIRSGLQPGDKVVTRGAGLLDNQLPEDVARSPK
jgi:cobalt-zinc-cadmium efflux system membrane fusion protein